MKRIIAAGFAGLLIFAGAASAATPAHRIAALEKQVKALNTKVTKQQKTINTLQKNVRDGLNVLLAIDYCLLGATTDALQSTWTTVDQSMATPIFGAQQTIGDGGACSALQIARQGIRTPPTTSVFSALVALLGSRTALRLG